jgi:uridine kinase
MERKVLLQQLAKHLLSLDPGHPLRVAIDGVDAAGKTILADELALEMEGHGRQMLRSSVDFFHYPAEVRHQRSDSSPESYYEDSFNYTALAELLLKPLGPGGNRRCRMGIYDYRVEDALQAPEVLAANDSILLFDGIFLQRPELLKYWDVRIFLQVNFTETVARAAVRDQYLFGTEEQVRARYENRYVPGQQLYLAQCKPVAKADILIENTDPLHPQVLRGLPM